jgi:hypothetical protein
VKKKSEGIYVCEVMEAGNGMVKSKLVKVCVVCTPGSTSKFVETRRWAQQGRPKETEGHVWEEKGKHPRRRFGTEQ